MERLATYGTLGPGRPNHHVVAGIPGAWTIDAVRGRLLEEGWGAAQGFPGIVLDPTADPIPVDLFTSPDLKGHWVRLDAFEGPDYVRVLATLKSGLTAQIYTLAPSVR